MKLDILIVLAMACIFCVFGVLRGLPAASRAVKGSYAEATGAKSYEAISATVGIKSATGGMSAAK